MTGFVVPLSIFSHQPAEVTDQEKETGDNHFLFSVRGHLWRGDLVPVLLCLHLLHHCLCLHPQQVLLFSARNWSAWWSFCFLIDSIAWKLLISPPPFSYFWAKEKLPDTDDFRISINWKRFDFSDTSSCALVTHSTESIVGWKRPIREVRGNLLERRRWKRTRTHFHLACSFGKKD